jgi:hypothetical protein
MALKIAESFKPVWDFSIQIVIGAIAFIIVLLAACTIAYVVELIERAGFAPAWLAHYAGFVERALFGLDLFIFGLFLATETLKAARGLYQEWKRT